MPVPGMRYVRLVHPRARHDEPEAVLDDQHVRFRAENFPGLTQYELDEPRILQDDARELHSARARLDLCEKHAPAFGFGDDLLRDDEDVTGLECKAVGCERAGEEVREVRAALDFPDAGQRSEYQLSHVGGPLRADGRLS